MEKDTDPFPDIDAGFIGQYHQDPVYINASHYSKNFWLSVAVSRYLQLFVHIIVLHLS